MEEYINNFSGITHTRLNEIYKVVKAQLPDASEKISYGVPTFYNENGPIIYFAGYSGFVSVYPVHQAVKLEQEVKPYLKGKSTARFSNSEPLPTELIKKLSVELEKVNRLRNSQ